MHEPTVAAFYSLDAEHPNASHFVILHARARDNHSMFISPTTGATWALMDRAGSLIHAADYHGENQHHQKAALPMLLQALQHVPACAAVHVVTDMDNIALIMTHGPAGRRQRKYKSGKNLYSDAELWKRLDAWLEERGLTMTAARPVTDHAKLVLGRLSLGSDYLARNIGKPHSEWEHR